MVWQEFRHWCNKERIHEIVLQHVMNKAENMEEEVANKNG